MFGVASYLAQSSKRLATLVGSHRDLGITRAREIYSDPSASDFALKECLFGGLRCIYGNIKLF